MKIRMNNKTKIIIIVSIIISIISSTVCNNITFLTDAKSLISIMLTILGLCFTSFSFISSSILKILNMNKENKNLSKKANNILSNIEENIFFIFYSVIILAILNLINNLDIPLIKNPTKLDFGIINILSLKQSIINFISSLLFLLTLYALHDIMKASFRLIKNCYIKS